MPHCFEQIAIALEDVREVLVAGPGLAKTEFSKFLARQYRSWPIGWLASRPWITPAKLNCWRSPGRSSDVSIK